MSAQSQFTIKQLVQIALGSERLTKLHISILQYVINILLKKLHCSHEKTTVVGTYRQLLKQQLNKSSHVRCPYFSCPTLDLAESKLPLLRKNTELITKVDAMLEKHFDNIRLSQVRTNPFCFGLWSHYGAGCEESCRNVSEENAMACHLVADVNFIGKVMMLLLNPILERMRPVEEKVLHLHLEMKVFGQKLNEALIELNIVGPFTDDIKKLQNQIQENDNKFLETMKEVEEMLITLVGKIHIPILKEYFLKECEKRTLQMDALTKRSMTCSNRGLIVSQTERLFSKCLSCGRENETINKIHRNDKHEKDEDLPSLEEGEHCGCPVECIEADYARPLMDRIRELRPNDIRYSLTLKGSTLKHRFQDEIKENTERDDGQGSIQYVRSFYA